MWIAKKGAGRNVQQKESGWVRAESAKHGEQYVVGSCEEGYRCGLQRRAQAEMCSKRRADGSGRRAQSMGSSMWSAAVNTADCSGAHRMGFTQSRRRGHRCWCWVLRAERSVWVRSATLPQRKSCCRKGKFWGFTQSRRRGHRCWCWVLRAERSVWVRSATLPQRKSCCRKGKF